jgi:hypothetical protein
MIHVSLSLIHSEGINLLAMDGENRFLAFNLYQS